MKYCTEKNNFVSFTYFKMKINIKIAPEKRLIKIMYFWTTINILLGFVKTISMINISKSEYIPEYTRQQY